MNAKVENSGGGLDTVKWLLVFVLVSAGVVGNYYFSAESLLYRVLALLVLAVGAGWVALQTDKGRRFSVLVTEARERFERLFGRLVRS